MGYIPLSCKLTQFLFHLAFIEVSSIMCYKVTNPENLP